MPRSVRLLAATTVALLAGGVQTAVGAAPSSAGAMRVSLDIVSVGRDGVAVPANLAVRTGGTVRLTVRNHTGLYHTFTVRALGITLIVPPHRSASTTFVAPYGVYTWRCLICSTPGHPTMHRMGGLLYAIVNA